MKCSRRVLPNFLFFVFSAFLLAIFSEVARADSLSIVYYVSQNQTAVVQQNTFTVVTFTGSVINNSGAPITFQLTGGPEPFEPYVASFQNGIGYPGITLLAGQSTATIDLAIVTLQLFDPSLTYPGTVNIVLQAIDPKTGSPFTENDASIRVVTSTSAVPEPSLLTMLVTVLLALLGIRQASAYRRNCFSSCVSRELLRSNRARLTLLLRQSRLRPMWTRVNWKLP